MARQVIVVPHDPAWTAMFSRAASQATPAFGENLLAIHHIGSTSVPSIYAKPIIDMLAVVSDITAVDQCQHALASFGYVARGEFGIAGRRYFVRNDDAGIRTHQIHAFQVGSPDVIRHLAFRDFLSSHPEVALAYSDLKRRLADTHPEDIEAYMDGKDKFIKDVQAQALIWTGERSI